MPQQPQQVLDAELVRAVRRTTADCARRADLTEALELHADRLMGLPLAAHCDVDTAQAFRDAGREDVVLNGVRFVGPHRTEAFVAAVKRLVATHVDAQTHPQRALLLADRVVRGCSRTLSGADAFFALNELFSSPDILIKPREATAAPLDVTLGQDSADRRLKCRIKSANLFGLYLQDELEQLLQSGDDERAASCVAVDTQVVELLDLSTDKSQRRLSIRLAPDSTPPSKLALEVRELF